MLPNVPKKLKYYPNIPWANPEILKNRNSQKILGWPGDVPKTHFLKKILDSRMEKRLLCACLWCDLALTGLHHFSQLWSLVHRAHKSNLHLALGCKKHIDHHGSSWQEEGQDDDDDAPNDDDAPVSAGWLKWFRWEDTSCYRARVSWLRGKESAASISKASRGIHQKRVGWNPQVGHLCS